jgi:hypothetical protein
VMVRPEALRIEALGNGGGSNGLRGRVSERRFAGAVTVYRVEIGDGPDLAITIPGRGAEFDGEVLVTPHDDPPLHAFAAEPR